MDSELRAKIEAAVERFAPSSAPMHGSVFDEMISVVSEAISRARREERESISLDALVQDVECGAMPADGSFNDQLDAYRSGWSDAWRELRRNIEERNEHDAIRARPDNSEEQKE